MLALPHNIDINIVYAIYPHNIDIKTHASSQYQHYMLAIPYNNDILAYCSAHFVSSSFGHFDIAK